VAVTSALNRVRPSVPANAIFFIQIILSIYSIDSGPLPYQIVTIRVN
jgi:hypothetical protein